MNFYREHRDPLVVDVKINKYMKNALEPIQSIYGQVAHLIELKMTTMRNKNVPGKSQNVWSIGLEACT